MDGPGSIQSGAHDKAPLFIAVALGFADINRETLAPRGLS